jgi:hypothetical protein
MASLVKMQVYLDQARYNTVKNMAKKLGVSMAQLIREWVDEKSQSRKSNPLIEDPFWRCVGKGDSGKKNIAQHFDDYLYGNRQ